MNPDMFDGSRWTNPVTLDGFTGRIPPCLMASADESYRAWWFLSCKSCHPALAAPVGQIPLGKVRLMKPTAFTATSVIGISANALWGKSTWATATLRLRGAQCARSPVQYATMPRLLGAQPATMPRLRGGAQSAAKPLSQSARAISALGSKRAIRCGAEPRNAKAASAPSIKAPKPFQHQGQGAWPVSAPRTQSAQAQTLNPNHRGKTRSSSAFSHRRFEGWQPRFQWDRIQQLPLHQAPGAYRQTPTQAPSRE